MAEDNITKLDHETVENALQDLAGWTYQKEEREITKTFKFKSFTKAFAFMSQVALLAAQMRHHPDWHNLYATVSVKLTTHDVDGVSDLDLKMAKKLNSYEKQYL